MGKGARAYIGIDIGTSSIAAVVVDGRGELLLTRTVANPSAGRPIADGCDEQDPDAILKSVNALIEKCEACIRERKLKLGEIGWTGQMHGLVAVDRRLRAITPLITWRDRRCAPPQLGAGILQDWKARRVKGIYRALTIPGYVIARRTGRCVVDATFRAAMGKEEALKPFAKWLPETVEDAGLLGDNQAGVYAALKLKPHAAVVNLGTSGQLSRVVAGAAAGAEAEVRPFPGGRKLICRASHLGGAALAKLRQSLGWSWERLNREAETNPRIAERVAAIVDDLARGVDLKGVRTIVGIGTALRLNPCLQRAIERRFRVRCVVPDVTEMAAWGAALYARDAQLARTVNKGNKRSVIEETLRHEILLGKYAVNERFPSEQMLVRRFKVARATVSQALAALKRAGIVRTRPGSGTYVAPLARGKGAIGLIVPGRGRGEIFEPICQAIEEEVKKLGYSVVACGRLQGGADERKRQVVDFANRCAEEHVAGVIVEPIELVPDCRVTTDEVLSLLDEMEIPVVLIDRDVTDTERSAYDLVGIDNFDAGSRLGELMVAAGAKRVAFLHFRESASTIRRRLRGVAQSVIDAGLRWGRRNVIELQLGDAHALAEVMQGRNPPEAIVCANDRTASFVIQTLSAIGLKVPEDVRVSGFDDLAYARGSKTQLTTMRQPCEELGRVALRTLVERILHPELPPRKILLTAELIRRKTA